MSDTTVLRVVSEHVQELKDRKLAIQRQRESLDAEEADVDIELAGVLAWQKTLRLSSAQVNGSSPSNAPRPPYQLRGLSGKLALHKVAEILGKTRLSSVEATDFLEDSGYSNDRRHAAKTVFREFGRGVKSGDWKKIEPGLYEQVRKPAELDSVAGVQTVLTEYQPKTRAYCPKCKLKRPLTNGSVRRVKNGRLRSEGQCNVCGSKIGAFGTN